MSKPLTPVPDVESMPQASGAVVVPNFQSTDWWTEVQKGNIAGHSIVHKFGRNDAVPAGSFAHVNLLGSNSWQRSAFAIVRVKAGNAADTAAGAGAREITVAGLRNSDFEYAESSIATAGLSASLNFGVVFRRLFRAWVSSAGTYAGANTGNVVIELAAGGDLLQINAGEGQSQFASYSVPLGKTAYVSVREICVDTVQRADVAFYTLDNLDVTVAPVSAKRLRKFWDGLAGSHVSHARSPIGPFSEKTDLWFEARGSGGGTEVCVDFEILLVDN